jgi:8-oxo-dGTP pyrophosphatase MutT (NUDIX family)
MIEATLCFILDGSPPTRILLGRKKRGFGCGKYNGLGGKVQPGETPVDTVIREVHEESGLIVSPDTLRSAGSITFAFPSRRTFDHHVHVFVTSAWEGEVRESAEIAPVWSPITEIPYDRMWNDDHYWLPLVLAGKRIRAVFTFTEDNETVDSWTIEEI